jgi:hypothetical protein
MRLVGLAVGIIAGVVFIGVTLSNNIIGERRVFALDLISQSGVGSCEFININLLSLKRSC